MARAFLRGATISGPALTLDEDFLFGRDGGEDLREGGDAGAGEFLVFPTADVEGLQLGEGGLGDDEVFAGNFFGVFVVDADDVAVFGELEVAFDAVGPLLPTQARRRGGCSRGRRQRLRDGTRKIAMMRKGVGRGFWLKRRKSSEFDHGMIKRAVG